MRGRANSELEVVQDDSSENEDDDEKESGEDDEDDEDDDEDSMPSTPELPEGDNKEPWSTYLLSCYESCGTSVALSRR
ncbi:unnamed protein product [Dibothriocephalus latus]|uniref:Uncharacterized protein n=1 Tax=Dibothriocephalus latus TaxID=60516 RepID=A0A3P7LN84_DIBLA|nr:unnamed protein product [Dibothriocephalus latus]